MARVKITAVGGLNTNEILGKNPDIESDQASKLRSFAPDGNVLKKPAGITGFGRPAMWMKVQAPENGSVIKVTLRIAETDLTFTFTYDNGVWNGGSLIAALQNTLVGCVVWMPSSSSQWYVVEPPAGIKMEAKGGSIMIPATAVSSTSSWIDIDSAVYGDMVTIGDYTYVYDSTYNPETRRFSNAYQLAGLIEADYGTDVIDATVSGGVVYLRIGPTKKIVYLSATGGIWVGSSALEGYYPNVFTRLPARAAFGYYATDGSTAEKFVVVADHVLAERGSEVFAPVFRSEDNEILRLVADSDVSAAQLYNTLYLTDGVEANSSLYGRREKETYPNGIKVPFFISISMIDPPNPNVAWESLVISECNEISENLPEEFAENGGPATISWSTYSIDTGNNIDGSGEENITIGGSSSSHVFMKVGYSRTGVAAPCLIATLRPNSSSYGINLRNKNNKYYSRGIRVRLFVQLGLTPTGSQRRVNIADQVYNVEQINALFFSSAGTGLSSVLGQGGRTGSGDFPTRRSSWSVGATSYLHEIVYMAPDSEVDRLKKLKVVEISVPRPTNENFYVSVYVLGIEAVSDAFDEGAFQVGVSYYNPSTGQETAASLSDVINATSRSAGVLSVTWAHPTDSDWKSRVYVRVNSPTKGDSGWRLFEEVDWGSGNASRFINRSAFELEPAPWVGIVPSASVKGRVLGVLRSSSRLVLIDCVEDGARSSQRVWISNRIDPLDPYNVVFPKLPPAGYPLPDDVRSAEHYGMIIDIPTQRRVNGVAEIGSTAYFFCDDVITRLRGTSPVDWVHSIVSSFLGCPSQYGFASTPYGIAFLGSDGAVWLLEVRTEDSPEQLRELGREGPKLYSCPIKYGIRSLARTQPTFDLSNASVIFVKNKLVVSCAYSAGSSESFTYVFDFTTGAWSGYYPGVSFRKGLTHISKKQIPGVGVTDEMVVYEHWNKWETIALYPTLANIFVDGVYGIARSDGTVKGVNSIFNSRLIRVAPVGYETRVRRLILDVDYEFVDEEGKRPQPVISLVLFNRKFEYGAIGVIGDLASVPPVASEGRSRVVVDTVASVSQSYPSAVEFWGNAVVVAVEAFNHSKRFDIHGIEVETFGLRKEPNE